MAEEDDIDRAYKTGHLNFDEYCAFKGVQQAEEKTLRKQGNKFQSTDGSIVGTPGRTISHFIFRQGGQQDSFSVDHLPKNLNPGIDGHESVYASDVRPDQGVNSGSEQAHGDISYIYDGTRSNQTDGSWGKPFSQPSARHQRLHDSTKCSKRLEIACAVDAKKLGKLDPIL